MSQDQSLFERARAEVIAFHEFFVGWYDAATADLTDFGRCDQAFGDGFQMIPPTGRVFDRAATIDLIRANRATFNGDFSIDIEDIRAGFQTDDTVVVTYVEVQCRRGVWSRRQASALFTASSSAPSGVQWRHLQETWLQTPET
ncbi:hypothetical protein [Rhizobium tumorigenes]|uniref:DUF4440 domain-containing protein n=1 Tax=Rhizobium tumorigenes TaxID=2041385 RepID=A0AAF1KSF4_9HYPH|nr:hypothetical protein [Rhizobium tumorigenes]WFR94706.1 hypothetical protein PR017_12855 [Rhizobium tumorigenes]